jgi:hypothetical protein
MLAIASVDPDNQERYAAAIRTKLHVFLAESAKPRRISDTGQIRSPVVKIHLSASERATLQGDLNEILTTKVHQAMLKERSATHNKLISALLGGRAKLTIDVEQIEFWPAIWSASARVGNMDDRQRDCFFRSRLEAARDWLD